MSLLFGLLVIGVLIVLVSPSTASNVGSLTNSIFKSTAPAATATTRPLIFAPTNSPIAASSPLPTPTSVRVAYDVNGTLTVHFLDVGQGDAILLQGSDFTILVDAGRHNANDVVPQLEAIGITSIDLLIGTHPHADHIGQFPEVLARYPVAEVWMSGDDNTTQTFDDALDAILNSAAAYREPRTGEVYQIGSARVEVMQPSRATGDINEESIVVRVVFGEVAFLLTGDSEAGSEREMLANGLDLHAQILKLAHHGSNTSSTRAFLQAVNPEIAIWSASSDNSYGHPSPVVLDRLADLGITVFGTAIDSSIVICTDGHSYNLGACTAQNGAIARVLAALQPEITPTHTPTPTRAPPPPETHSSGCTPGQININTASQAELEDIYQIGEVRAAAMIRLRPFTSIDDMDRISGISQNRVQEIKAQGLACVD